MSEKNPGDELIRDFYKTVSGVQWVATAAFYTAMGGTLALFLYFAVFPFLIAGWRVCLLTVLIIIAYLIYCLATWDGK